MEKAIGDKYDDMAPRFSESLIERVYGVATKGQHWKHTDRGGNRAWNSRGNLANGVYGGMPAAINGLNAVKEVFEAR